jgi:Predicted membrane protein
MLKKTLKNKALRKELIGYMIAGTLATIVDLSIFSFLTYRCFWHCQVALTCSFIISTMCSLWLNSKYVFNMGTNHPWWRVGMRHYFASFGNLLVNQLGMFMLIAWFGFPNLILGRIIIIVSTFLINFIIVKKFVFKTPKN